jgi:UDP:flavonoid glycosyltransferase YjiC (YdhE family)
MNRFLFTTWPFPGHFFAQIAIADALRERGHQCAFYTGIQACRVLEDETFKCFPFKHLDEEKLYQVMFSQQRGSWEWKEIFRFQATLSRWLLDTIPQHSMKSLESPWQYLHLFLLACCRGRMLRPSG